MPSLINFFFFFLKKPLLFLLSYLRPLQYLPFTATINASSISFAGNHIGDFTQFYDGYEFSYKNNINFKPPLPPNFHSHEIRAVSSSLVSFLTQMIHVSEDCTEYVIT